MVYSKLQSLEKTHKTKNYENNAIGKTKIVLAVDDKTQPTGVLADLTVEVVPDEENEITFCGVGEFEKETKEHIRCVIYPLIVNVLDMLGLKPRPVKISLANIGAASLQEKRLSVKGFSADISIFLAMVSAYLKIPIRQDFVATGHISSDQGKIAMVESIPGKIHGTLQYSEITEFVCPDPSIDQSARVFHPDEIEKIKVAISQAGNRLKIKVVSSICDLVGTILQSKELLYGSLQSGFFSRQTNDIPQIHSHISYEFVRLLTENHENQFWDLIYQALIANQYELVREFVSLRVQHHFKRRTYPRDFGSHFFQVLQSLIPSKRPSKIIGQYISERDLFKLSKLAHENDIEDLRFLNKSLNDCDHIPSIHILQSPGNENEYDLLLDFLLKEVDGNYIDMNITRRIDNARESFRLGVIQLDEYHEFVETIEAYYFHVLRLQGMCFIPSYQTTGGAEAMSLLNRAYGSNEGTKYAWKQVKFGTNGGLRSVLDAMTDQLKSEQKEEHIELVLTEILDPDCWPDLIKFGRAMKRRFCHFLPSEFTALADDDIARNYKNIIRYIIQYIRDFQNQYRL